MIDRFDFPTLFGTASPVLWFGISAVVGALLGLAASEIFKRRNPVALRAGAPTRLLAALTAVDTAALAVFALSGNLWLAFAMLWARVIVGAIGAPAQLAWLNRNLDSASRATVISMSGQVNSIGQVGDGLALGWVGNAVSIRAALLGSALILSPTVALCQRMAVHGRAVPEPDNVPTTF